MRIERFTEITIFLNNQKTFKAQCTYVEALLKESYKGHEIKDTRMEKKGLEAFKGLVCKKEETTGDEVDANKYVLVNYDIYAKANKGKLRLI